MKGIEWVLTSRKKGSFHPLALWSAHTPQAVHSYRNMPNTQTHTHVQEVSQLTLSSAARVAGRVATSLYVAGTADSWESYDRRKPSGTALVAKAGFVYWLRLEMRLSMYIVIWCNMRVSRNQPATNRSLYTMRDMKDSDRLAATLFNPRWSDIRLKPIKMGMWRAHNRLSSKHP